MTKQEEIEEGTIAFWQDTSEKLTRGLLINLVLVYLRWLQSKGVVIKVQRELPRVERYVGEDWSAPEADSYFEAREDMLEAGYVVVEPLIGDELV